MCVGLREPDRLLYSISSSSCQKTTLNPGKNHENFGFKVNTHTPMFGFPASPTQDRGLGTSAGGGGGGGGPLRGFPAADGTAVSLLLHSAATIDLIKNKKQS